MRTTEPAGIGIVAASRLIASVVFFVKITVSRRGSAPTNAPTTSRACSYAAVLSRERWPVPRCTLPLAGRNAVDGVGDRLPGRRAGGVVEVDVGDPSPPSTVTTSSIPIT